MSFAIQFDAREVNGVADVMQALSLANRRELFDNIGSAVVSQTLWRFEDEQDPDGNDWIPSQRAEQEGGKTLQDHGHLRDSITYVLDLSGESVEVGSNMVYAAIHQFGGVANDYTALDARTYLGVTAENQNDIGELALDYYRGLLQ